MSSNSINIKNRKASFSYQLIDKFVAGIVLVGTEIKSIRNNQAHISDAYCLFIENELWVRNLHIDEYSNNGHHNHEPKRARKLLLNRIELNKIDSKIKESDNMYGVEFEEGIIVTSINMKILSFLGIRILF